MQQRQTVIFGSIIAVLLGVALFAGAVWAEIVPAPFTIEMKSPEPEAEPVVTQPCPPEGAFPVPLGEVSVNVLNSTETSGLGARTAESLAAHGLTVESVGNASDRYLGTAKVLAGVEYLDVAYTVADLIPGSQVVYDVRTEAIVDVVIGVDFSEINSEEERQLDPEEPIPAPSGCMVIEGLDDDETDGAGDSDEEEPSEED